MYYQKILNITSQQPGFYCQFLRHGRVPLHFGLGIGLPCLFISFRRFFLFLPLPVSFSKLRLLAFIFRDLIRHLAIKNLQILRSSFGHQTGPRFESEH
jgi:hypothetical protein